MDVRSQKILVVDNHPLFIHFLAALLQKEGHEVITAGNALEALEILKGFRPDVLFVDMVMPYISGAQLCRIIRSVPEFQHTNIVVLSAVAAEEHPDFLRFGANACLAKGPLGQMAGHVLEILARFREGHGDEPQIIGLEGVYRRQVTLELLSSTRRLESILENITQGILELTPGGKIIFANQAALDFFGTPEENLLAVDFSSLLPPAVEAVLKERLERLGSGGLPGSEEPMQVTLGGRLLSLRFRPLAHEDSASIIVILRDVTERAQMEQALRESEKKYRLLFSEMASGFIFYQIIADESGKPCDYRFLEVNSAFERMTGLQAAEVIGQTITAILPEDSRVLLPAYREIAVGSHARFEHRCTLTGKQLEITAYCPAAGHLAVLTNDITPRKHLEAKLHEASTTDELTGLLNRRGFIAMAEQQLKIAVREKSAHFLMFADFDDLKFINDHLGHLTGDQAIAEMAGILKATFREADILGRLGGDEFAILLTGPPGDDHGRSALARLGRNMQSWNQQPDRQYHLSMSCGLAEFDPRSPCPLDELLRLADHEMYEEKRRRKHLAGTSLRN